MQPDHERVHSHQAPGMMAYVPASTTNPRNDMNTSKRVYVKPTVTAHGKVEEVTGFTGGHDVFGGGFLSQGAKAHAKKHGPADFGS
jgi:hypothetical protein